MIGLVFDENFNNDVVRGLLRRDGSLDLVRIQDVGLRTLDDEAVLGWAAEAGRIVITHDVSTMTDFAYRRVEAGLRMPGVFEVPRSVAIGIAITDLWAIAACSEPGEWEGQVRYLPLR